MDKSGWILAYIFARDQTFVIPIDIATSYHFMEPTYQFPDILVWKKIDRTVICSN